MRVDEIRHIAREHGVKASGLKKTDLIHEIQRQEGNAACYGTDHEQRCDQLGCLWRADCSRESVKKLQ